MYIDCHNDRPSCPSITEIDSISSDGHQQDWLDCSEDQGANGAVHFSNKRRQLSVSKYKGRQIPGY